MKKKFENIENSNITDNSVNIEQKNKDGNNVLNIIIGTGKSKPNYLTLPPFNTKVFEGREKALQEVREKLLNGNTILLINGQGGIGKTTFAAKYWRKYENEYQHLGVLYVSNGIGDALLNRDFTGKLGINFLPQLTNEEKLEIVFDYLAQLEKPCLLILDNANDAEDLGKYVVALSKCLNFHILLTSRLANFENTYPYALGALDKEAALNVFQQNYKHYEPTDEPLFYEIFEAVGGNTLVMELLAKNLNNFNRNKQNYSLQNLYDDLQNSLLNLSKSKEVHTAYQAQGTGLRYEKPEVIILAMYDLSKLTENEIALLSAFAVLPPENIAFTTLETLLNSETLEDNLEKLIQKGWIEFDKTTKSYKVSPVVQEVVREKNKERLFGDCEQLINFLVKKLNWQENLNYHKENYKYTIIYNMYAESVANSLLYLKNLQKLQYVSVLLEKIGYFYEIIGNFIKAFDCYNKANLIIEQIYKTYSTNFAYGYNLAISYKHLGEICSKLNFYDKALYFFEQDNALSIKLCKKNSTDIDLKNSLAISYSNLGQIYHLMDNTNKALYYFEIYHQLAEELYNIFPDNIEFINNLGIAYSKLGEIHRTLGQIGKALIYSEKDAELIQKLYDRFPTNIRFKSNLGISYSKLAGIYIKLGNLDTAFNYLEKCNQLGNELCNSYPNNIEFKKNLALYIFQFSILYSNSNRKKAIHYCLESQRLLLELAQTCPDYVELQENLSYIQSCLENFNHEAI